MSFIVVVIVFGTIPGNTLQSPSSFSYFQHIHIPQITIEIPLEPFYCCSICLFLLEASKAAATAAKKLSWMFSIRGNNTFLRVYKSHHKCWQYPEICSSFFWYFWKAKTLFCCLFSTPSKNNKQEKIYGTNKSKTFTIFYELYLLQLTD